MSVRIQPKHASALVSGGLMTLQLPADLDDVFDFITAGLPLEMQQMTASPLTLLRHLWQPAPLSTLDLPDYQHLQTQLQIMRAYLEIAILDRKAGVNILLYGPPGNGKTELARLMASLLVQQSYQVSSEDEDQDILSGAQRLRAYQIAQRCLAAGERTILIFDEAEDVFAQNPFSRSFVNSKAWMNQMLEQNPVPCIWLSNDISCMDNAVIRRFDLVIEVTQLPKEPRARLMRQAAGGLLSEEDAQKLTAHPELTAAVIKRAADVVGIACKVENSGQKFTEGQMIQRHNLNEKKAFALVINSTLKAQGFNPHQALPLSIPTVYNPAFINADIDWCTLLAGIARVGNARICLSGPPGSGKTAFCQYLADQLDKTLQLKPASELLSCYVGESEKLIANAFQAATEDNAVLLLDEVDSFLQQRSKAEHSWQVTQVNELLQQMERFNGILLATTNQLTMLDQAALRRFDLIIEFGFLQPEQARSLLTAHCKALDLSLQQSALAQVGQLPMLTLGDFQAIARQHNFCKLVDSDAFVSQLLKAVARKGAEPMLMSEPAKHLQ